MISPRKLRRLLRDVAEIKTAVKPRPIPQGYVVKGMDQYGNAVTETLLATPPYFRRD